MKKKKHDKIVKDYENQKSKHLEKLASKILEKDEKLQKLKGKNINTNFLNLF
jgi:uncharacterized protein (DUF1330 family)